MVPEYVSKDPDFSRLSVFVYGNTKGVLHDFADKVLTVIQAFVEIAAVYWLAHFVSSKGVCGKVLTSLDHPSQFS